MGLENRCARGASGMTVSLHIRPNIHFRQKILAHTKCLVTHYVYTLLRGFCTLFYGFCACALLGLPCLEQGCICPGNDLQSPSASYRNSTFVQNPLFRRVCGYQRNYPLL